MALVFRPYTRLVDHSTLSNSVLTLITLGHLGVGTGDSLTLLGDHWRLDSGSLSSALIWMLVLDGHVEGS